MQHALRWALILLAVATAGFGQDRARRQRADELYQEAWFAETEGRTVQALELYTRLVEEFGDFTELAADTAQRAGSCCERLDRTDEARRWYERALVLAPDSDAAALARERLEELAPDDGLLRIAILPDGVELRGEEDVVTLREGLEDGLRTQLQAWFREAGEPVIRVAKVFGSEAAVAVVAQVLTEREGIESLTASRLDLLATVDHRLEGRLSVLDVERDGDLRAWGTPPLFILAGALEAELGRPLDVPLRDAHGRVREVRDDAPALEYLRRLVELRGLELREQDGVYTLSGRWQDALVDDRPFILVETPLGEVAAAHGFEVDPPLRDYPLTTIFQGVEELAAELGLEVKLSGSRYRLSGYPPPARTGPRLFSSDAGLTLLACRDRLEDVMAVVDPAREVDPVIADMLVSVYCKDASRREIFEKLERLLPMQLRHRVRTPVAEARLVRLDHRRCWVEIGPTSRITAESAPMYQVIGVLESRYGPPGLPQHIVHPAFELRPFSDVIYERDGPPLEALRGMLPYGERGPVRKVHHEVEHTRRYRMFAHAEDTGPDIALDTGLVFIPDGQGLFSMHASGARLDRVLAAFAERGLELRCEVEGLNPAVYLWREHASLGELAELLCAKYGLQLDPDFETWIVGFDLDPIVGSRDLRACLERLRRLFPGFRHDPLPPRVSPTALEELGPWTSFESALESTLRQAGLRATWPQGAEGPARINAAEDGPGAFVGSYDGRLGDVVAELAGALAPARVELAPGLAERRVRVRLAAASPEEALQQLADELWLSLERTGPLWSLAPRTALATIEVRDGLLDIEAQKVRLDTFCAQLSSHLPRPVRPAPELRALLVSVEQRATTAERALERVARAYGLVYEEDAMRPGPVLIDAEEAALAAVLEGIGYGRERIDPAARELPVSLTGKFASPAEALDAVAAAAGAQRNPEELGRYLVQPRTALTVHRVPGGEARLVALADGGAALFVGERAAEEDVDARLAEWAEGVPTERVVALRGAAELVRHGLQARGYAVAESTSKEVGFDLALLGLPDRAIHRNSRGAIGLGRGLPMPLFVWLGVLEATLAPQLLHCAEEVAEAPFVMPRSENADTPFELLLLIERQLGLEVSEKADGLRLEGRGEATPITWSNGSYFASFGAPFSAVVAELGLTVTVPDALAPLPVTYYGKDGTEQHLRAIVERFGLELAVAGGAYTVRGEPTLRPDVRLHDRDGLVSLFAYRQPLGAVLAALGTPYDGLRFRCEERLATLPVSFYGERLPAWDIAARLAERYGLALRAEEGGISLCDATGALGDSSARQVDAAFDDVSLQRVARLLSPYVDGSYRVASGVERRVSFYLSGVGLHELAEATADRAGVLLVEDDDGFLFRPRPLAHRGIVVRVHGGDAETLEGEEDGARVIELSASTLLSRVEELLDEELPLSIELMPDLTPEAELELRRALASLEAWRGIVERDALAARLWRPARIALAAGDERAQLRTLELLYGRLAAIGHTRPDWMRGETPEGFALADLQDEIRTLKADAFDRLDPQAVDVETRRGPTDQVLLQIPLLKFYFNQAEEEPSSPAEELGNIPLLHPLLNPAPASPEWTLRQILGETRRAVADARRAFLDRVMFRPLPAGGYALRAEPHEDVLRWLTCRGRLEIVPVRDAEAPGRRAAAYDGAELWLETSKALLIDQVLTARVARDVPLDRVEIRLRERDAGSLEELTTAELHGRLALCFDGEPLSVVTVQSPISGGEIWMTGHTLRHAELLAELLRQPPLPVAVERLD